MLKIKSAVSSDSVVMETQRIAFVKTFELSGTLMTPGVEARSEEVIHQRGMWGDSVLRSHWALIGRIYLPAVGVSIMPVAGAF